MGAVGGLFDPVNQFKSRHIRQAQIRTMQSNRRSLKSYRLLSVPAVVVFVPIADQIHDALALQLVILHDQKMLGHVHKAFDRKLQ